MSAYGDLIFLDRAVAYWPLDDAGPVAADATGHGHDGTAAGGVLFEQSGPPQGRTACSFDGTSGYLDLAAATTLPAPDPTHSFSAESWVNPGNDFIPPNGTGRPWLELRGAADTDFQPGVTAKWRGPFPGQPVGPAAILCEETEFGYTVGATDDLRASWHHVVHTYDAPSRTGLTYLDGLPIAALSEPFTTAGDPRTSGAELDVFSPQRAWIGGRLRSLDNGLAFWRGLLGHVAVYDYALTPCQVLAHYTQAVTGAHTPCGPATLHRTTQIQIIG